MRILLIAYEFPPILSGQSIRWYYLANAMAGQGVKVRVLTTTIYDIWGWQPPLHQNIKVTRVFPGPLIGIAGWLAARRSSGDAKPDTANRVPKGAATWLYRHLRRGLDQLLLPDACSEWLPFAWCWLQRFLRDRSIDVIISSHEPGVALLLGLRAKRRYGLPWIADLGDPILLPTTPRWRLFLDKRLERQVGQYADHLLLTNEVLKQSLLSRNNLGKDKISIIPQGYPRRIMDCKPADSDKVTFRILYSGAFYKDFREPQELAAAIAALELPRLQLVILGAQQQFYPLFQGLEDRLVWLEPLSHEKCLQQQCQADVLINLGNCRTEQVPGKLFEYLGAQRPILHIEAISEDPATKMVQDLARGVTCRNKRDSIAEAVRLLYHQWKGGQLCSQYDLSLEAIEPFSWEARADHVQKICERVATRD